ncbi:nucleosome assembly protein [Xylaria arbuscula]|nr:nucleosome assembly protein [Xylaria arbuscula]
MASDRIDEINVCYEDLLALERDFEDVEIDIIAKQYHACKPLHEKRADLIAKIPNFWRLVFEQAPPDIDQYIQPNDSALLLSSLESFSVSRFELDAGANGEPRSLSIRMEFSENDYFEDKVLEKKFWHRRARDGIYDGLVSEPVPIKWKPGKDLTQGLLDLAVKVWEQDKKAVQAANGTSTDKKKTKPEDWTPDQTALRDKIDLVGQGGMSFFCWFGFRGRHISAEEDALAREEDKKRRAERASGKPAEPENHQEAAAEEEDDDDDDDDDDDPLVLDIFRDGDDLAVAFSDDLWLNAIKYFNQAQEADAVSEFDFEDDDEEEEAPPLKKVKR